MNTLEENIFQALRTYSNVHRGSGYNSRVTTELYEDSRIAVLEHLGLNKKKYSVIFCSPRYAHILTSQMEAGSYQCLSSEDVGLSVGVRAVAARRSALPRGVPPMTGGGTARLISRDWVIWTRPPERFEAGTPAVINILAFTLALKGMKANDTGQPEGDSDDPGLIRKVFGDDGLTNLKGNDLLIRLRLDLIGKDLIVTTSQGNLSYINLDNAASTRTFIPIWEAYRKALHLKSKEKKVILEHCRDIISGFLGAPLAKYDILFTSNTTEAINIAAESICKEVDGKTQPVVLNTMLEHNSNELPWRYAEGIHLERLSVDNEGFINTAELESVLQQYNEAGKYGNRRIRIVAICGASNVLGTCNDIAAIGNLAHRYGAKLLVDAAQLAAHRRVDMTDQGIDFLAFSGHKTYAPFGSGALIARKGLLSFNNDELSRIRNSGEENVAGIAALGKALELLGRIGMDVIRQEEAALTSRFLLEMKNIQGIRLHGIKDPSHPLFKNKAGVISFDFKSKMADKIAGQLSATGGIGIRAGCHCAHMIVKKTIGLNPALERIQRVIVRIFPSLQLPGIARVSLGIENSEEDVSRFTETLTAIVGKK